MGEEVYNVLKCFESGSRDRLVLYVGKPSLNKLKQTNLIQQFHRHRRAFRPSHGVTSIRAGNEMGHKIGHDLPRSGLVGSRNASECLDRQRRTARSLLLLPRYQ